MTKAGYDAATDQANVAVVATTGVDRESPRIVGGPVPFILPAVVGIAVVFLLNRFVPLSRRHTDAGPGTDTT